MNGSSVCASHIPISLSLILLASYPGRVGGLNGNVGSALSTPILCHVTSAHVHSCSDNDTGEKESKLLLALCVLAVIKWD